MCQRDRSALACSAKSERWFWSGSSVSGVRPLRHLKLGGTGAPGNASIKGETNYSWLGLAASSHACECVHSMHNVHSGRGVGGVHPDPHLGVVRTRVPSVAQVARCCS